MDIYHYQSISGKWVPFAEDVQKNIQQALKDGKTLCDVVISNIGMKIKVTDPMSLTHPGREFVVKKIRLETIQFSHSQDLANGYRIVGTTTHKGKEFIRSQTTMPWGARREIVYPRGSAYGITQPKSLLICRGLKVIVMDDETWKTMKEITLGSLEELKALTDKFRVGELITVDDDGEYQLN